MTNHKSTRWHRWFAWYPVKDDLCIYPRWMWLRVVERIELNGKWFHQPKGWNT